MRGAAFSRFATGDIKVHRLIKVFWPHMRGAALSRCAAGDIKVHRLIKVFGSPETFFQKGFWPPEAN